MDMRVADLFKIGIGPSSSHTVGPMLAARRFLQEAGALDQVCRVQVELYGSLALTGVGHATDRAVLLGLMGETPQEVVLEGIPAQLSAVAQAGQISLLGKHAVRFDAAHDLLWHKRESLPEHPNGMRFSLAYNDGSSRRQVFYSTGGGFIRAEGEVPQAIPGQAPLPFGFDTMEQLLAHGQRSGLSLAAMVRANELAVGSAPQLDAFLDQIWQVMRDGIARGLELGGELPGGLHVRRRAAALWQAAQAASPTVAGAGPGIGPLPHDALHRVSLYAMAVNEENAAGGRVVTAPTNGAAGIIPAVLRYYAEDCKPRDAGAGVRDFLLTAAAIGMLCKRNASISGAEIGCQGEVGVACAMAAAGLAAALGGSNQQIENAAEIGIEHNLGLTCDPIAGLVQIPCIERNGLGAVKAIAAASLAIKGDGRHHVSFDQVVETMRQTGADMMSKYKETSLGGLALHRMTVNYPAC